MCVFVQSNLVKHLLREYSELRSSGLFRAAFGASSELGVSENGRLRGLRGGGGSSGIETAQQHSCGAMPPPCSMGRARAQPSLNTEPLARLLRFCGLWKAFCGRESFMKRSASIPKLWEVATPLRARRGPRKLKA